MLNFQFCSMNWIKKQWERFLEKPFWSKFWDITLLVILLILVIPEGRIGFQRILLKTGVMGSTKANTSETLPSSDWNWQLMDLDGQTTSFEAFADQPVFLNHWATWCPPCRAEMPSVISLIEKTGQSANFILLTSEDPEKVKSFLEKQNWDLPVYFPVSPIPEQLQAESLPTTLIINTQGTIIHRSEGMRDWGSDKAVELLTESD